jgi:Aldo/keto reductase family
MTGAPMTYRRLPTIDKPVSAVGIMPASMHGLDRLGQSFETQVSEAEECFLRAREIGVNYFEVAVAASVAAVLEVFGTASKDKRDALVVAGHLFRNELGFIDFGGQRTGTWDECIRIVGRLGYEYLDVLWVPEADWDDALVVADLQRLVAAGVVRALGVESSRGGRYPLRTDLPPLRRRPVTDSHDAPEAGPTWSAVRHAHLQGTALVGEAVRIAESALFGTNLVSLDERTVRLAIGGSAVVVLAARDATDVTRLAGNI